MMHPVKKYPGAAAAILCMWTVACGTDSAPSSECHPAGSCDEFNDTNDTDDAYVCASYWTRPLTTADRNGESETDAAIPPERRHLNPGHPVITSAGEATKCNDGEYGVDYWGIGTETDNRWTASAPAFCALNLEHISATEILVALSDETGTTNIEGWPGFRNYIISTSADATDGSDGSWHEQISIFRNKHGYREHRIPFSGQRWVKVTVKTPVTAVLDELDVWDVSDEPDELPASIIWVGDSITARCTDRHGTFGARPSLQKVINSSYAPHYPLQIGAGTVGLNSANLLKGDPSKLDTYLSMYPDIRFWAIQLGTNEAIGEMNSEEFHNNLTRIVHIIEAAEHQPIIAKIPYAPSRALSLAIERLNTVIEEVTKQKNLTPGPDLFDLFQRNADRYYSEEDKIHPNRIGCTAWQQAWADIIGPLID